MKLFNGLLGNFSFVEVNTAFFETLKRYPDYEKLIKFLRFRYYDCYDMRQFFINLEETLQIFSTKLKIMRIN